jgi:hypothetical protein
MARQNANNKFHINTLSNGIYSRLNFFYYKYTLIVKTFSLSFCHTYRVLELVPKAQVRHASMERGHVSSLGLFKCSPTLYSFFLLAR